MIIPFLVSDLTSHPTRGYTGEDKYLLADTISPTSVGLHVQAGASLLSILSMEDPVINLSNAFHGAPV